ncbi:MAG: hypothetical protein WDA75_03440 [Candidatus Latescibacterota bacterium]
MGGVDGLVGDLVDLIQDVEKITLGVDADALDAGQDLADDLLARAGIRTIAQPPEVR